MPKFSHINPCGDVTAKRTIVQSYFFKIQSIHNHFYINFHLSSQHLECSQTCEGTLAWLQYNDMGGGALKY